MTQPRDIPGAKGKVMSWNDFSCGAALDFHDCALQTLRELHPSRASDTPRPRLPAHAHLTWLSPAPRAARLRSAPVEGREPELHLASNHAQLSWYVPTRMRTPGQRLSRLSHASLSTPVPADMRARLCGEKR